MLWHNLFMEAAIAVQETDSEPKATKSASGGGDERTLLANERTLLSWVRTSVAIVGLGFLVARFNLLVRYTAHNTNSLANLFAAALGLAIAALGALALLLAVITYRTREHGHVPRILVLLQTGLWILLVLAAATVVAYLYITI
jgi:putative membrane protein